MQKAEFKVICRFYGIKPRALKECLKKENIKLKSATKREVLNIIFVYAPDLMFTRSLGDGTVEYHYPDITKSLVNDLSQSNQNDNTAKTLTAFEKWEQLQEYHYESGYGAIFEPQSAYKKYDIAFATLSFKVDYDVYTTVTIGQTLEPGMMIAFTDTGIKKLLQSNQKMIDEVERLWKEELDNPDFTKCLKLQDKEV